MSDEQRIVSIDITHLVRAALATAGSDDESPTAKASSNDIPSSGESIATDP